MDITLIVKASNQQFDDQTIKCEPSWTIRRLKGHLTEVYPGKPTTDEQKLIYSGQLLGDSVVLKDILRHYDGQQAHTVHLVFTPKNNRHRDFSTKESSGGSSSSKTMSPKAGTESGATSSTAAASSRTSSEPVRSPEPATDGLRQRHVGTGAQSSQAVPTLNATSPMTPASADYIMGQHLAMQNWVQQAYMQYLNQYMNVISNGQNPQSLYVSAPTNMSNHSTPQPSPQMNATLAAPADQNPILAQTLPNLAYYPYLSTVNSSPMPSASSIPAPITSSGTIAASSPPSSVPGSSSQPTIPSSASTPSTAASPATVVPGTSPASSPSTSSVANGASTAAAGSAVEDTSAAAARAQPAPPADAAPVAAAAAAAAPARRFPNIVVEEQENRDWLDIFFSICRVGILMTVVYLYSSPTRCLTVFLIGIALYLYQIGFFRNNNTDRLERARQMVVQQMNNAHGIRPNGAAGLRARAPLVPAAAEPAAAAANAQAPASPQLTASTTAAKADSDTTDGAKPAESASSSAEIRNTDSSVEETPAPAAVESNAEEQTAGPSAIAPEANRVNLNDIAAFLRTLVLSFFTSIIPDMPAA